MLARAHLATELRSTGTGPPRTVVSRLRSQAPLVLRPTIPKCREPWAASRPQVPRVCLAAGAAGPLGGDQLELEVEVGAGSELVLTEVSPTLLLPGPHGEQSRLTVRIRVAAAATLIWLPEPVIAARGCSHLSDVQVLLEPGARFLMREELLLGRHGEQPGTVLQRVRVRLAGRPLYSQDLSVGTPGADTPAVLGGGRAVGSVLVVDPDFDAAFDAAGLAVHRLGEHAAVLPLAGPAAVVTAVAADNLALRGHLDDGLAALGPPWSAPSSQRTGKHTTPDTTHQEAR